ncbi:hypothetical protein F4810DRAFT_78792 [Camillea tinctor]|nr:hypothetical protein F4810DRAFT_78792 [Camillea tinctor]
MKTPHFNTTTAVLAAGCLGSAVQARRLLSQTANLTLFSDPACADPVYANGFVLGVDMCGRDDAAAPSPYAGLAVHARPWCPDGSRPVFQLYEDADCAAPVQFLMPLGAMYGGGEDGTCVAPGEFRGMAFLCGGLWGEESDEDEGDESDEEDGEAVTVTSSMSYHHHGASTMMMSTTAPASAAPTEGATTDGVASSTEATATAVPNGGAVIMSVQSGSLWVLSTLVIAAVAI